MKVLPNRFPDAIVEAIRVCQVLGIRAGRTPHRVIAIWAVVVERRVFVRSWSLKPRSWHRAFLEDLYTGIIQINGREVTIRAVQTRSDRIKDAVSQAYLDRVTHLAQSSSLATWDGRNRVRPRPNWFRPEWHARAHKVESRAMARSRISSICLVIAGLLLLLSACAHADLGWPAMREELTRVWRRRTYGQHEHRLGISGSTAIAAFGAIALSAGLGAGTAGGRVSTPC